MKIIIISLIIGVLFRHCCSVIPVGSNNETVRVVINQPILEVYPKDPHVVIAGSSITLECRESAGYSDMKFTWSREDDSSLPSNVHKSENGSLKIMDIAINQEGRYKCSAANGLASASITTEIEVRTLPVIKIPKIIDRNITGKLGDGSELICVAVGHPQPSVQWQKFSPETQSFQAVTPATLNAAVYEIASLSTSVEGLYLCSATNAAGSSNQSVRVVIEQPMLEVYPKDPHVVIAGNSITLECRESVGYLNMTFTWSRDDECGFASNIHQSDSGSLTITDIRIYQGGRFNCSASSGLTSTSVTTEIVVRTLPVIEIPEITDENITKKLGDKVELTCDTEGHPEPSVQWRKFSPEAESFQAVQPATLNFAVHEIASLVTSEAGLYLCSAMNPAGSSNKTVRVVIKQPILGIYPNDSHVVIAGSSITLECYESAGYSDMKFAWSREDNISLPSNVVQSDKGVLTITNITVNEGGRYTCSATHGELFTSATAVIDVDSPLSEIKITEQHHSLTYVLTCQAIGGKASYKWTFKDGDFLYDEVIEGNVLSFNVSSMKEKKSRVYCCEAFNTAGSSTECHSLHIKVLWSRHLYGRFGDSVELVCRLMGVEPSEYTVHWRRNRSPLPNTAIAVDDYLRIPKLSWEDDDVYTCFGHYVIDGADLFYNYVTYLIVE